MHFEAGEELSNVPGENSKSFFGGFSLPAVTGLHFLNQAACLVSINFTKVHKYV